MKLQAASFALTMALARAPALAADPQVPLGQDPGGTAVAIISTGIDYTIPEIAKSLARDGEGEIIAWDFVDGDNRPYAISATWTDSNQPPPDATAPAAALVREDFRIVAVRCNVHEPMQLAQAIAFASKTPARIVIMTLSSSNKQAWEPIHQAARRFKDIQFVVYTSGNREAQRPSDNFHEVQHHNCPVGISAHDKVLGLLCLSAP